MKINDTPLKAADPLTIAVVRSKLKSIVEEVVEVMARTAFSPLLSQSRDFSAAIIDGAGQLLSQAERVPIHMGALPFAVQAVVNRFGDDVQANDVYLLNDPYHGGSHLPDFTLCMPVVQDGDILYWVVNRAHQGDIGGISPGGYSPKASEIWHEGLRIPPVRLVEQGRTSAGLLDLICLNSRMPVDLRGDILAQLASVRAGHDRLAELLSKYGARHLQATCEAILDAGERASRAQIRSWQDGVYSGESWLDPIEAGGRPISFKVKITIREDKAEIDLRDCDDQLGNFLNSSLANTMAAVNVAFMYLGETQDVQNAGSARPLTVLTRPGSILDPLAPAPVTACTTLTASVVIEVIMKALEPAAPRQVLCGFARRFRFAIAHHDRSGKPAIWHYFSNRGGAGGNAENDGWFNLGVVHSPGGNMSPSVERTESVYPFKIEQYELRPDSAGAGLHRGGLGGIYILKYEGEAAGQMTPTGDGVEVPPYGLAGGKPGRPNKVMLERDGVSTVLASKAATEIILPGDRLICMSAGGGGHGPAEKRDAALVERDLRLGYVTVP